MFIKEVVVHFANAGAKLTKNGKDWHESIKLNLNGAVTIETALDRAKKAYEGYCLLNGYKMQDIIGYAYLTTMDGHKLETYGSFRHW